MSKNLYIISGCNGAGKTTASYTVLPEILDCKEFVNADEIARGLSPFNPESMAIEAGRLMLKRIEELSDTYNPADTIADILLKEFLRMHNDKDGYWKNIPLLPQKMINPNVWAALMAYAGRILASKSENNKFSEAKKKALEQIKKGREETDQYIREECEKYGVDPESDDRQAKLLIKKQLETSKDESPAKSYDIF